MALEKRELANIEYAVLVPLINQRIAFKWFSKIQKIQESVYRLKLGNENLVVWLGKAVFLSSSKEFQALEDQFCKRITKALENSKLVSITQLGSDRIIVLEFRDKKLVIEMFGKGNILLIDSASNTILDCLKEESWSSREIRKGRLYVQPVSVEFPATLEQFRAYLISREKNYVAVSLSKLPIGITYVRKILSLLGIEEKARASELSDSALGNLYTALSQLGKSTKSFAIYQGDSLADFLLAELGEGVEQPDAISLVEQYYSSLLEPAEKKDGKKQGFELQKKALKEKAEKCLAIAREIESNTAEFEEIAQRARAGEKKGESENYCFEMDYGKGLLKVKKKTGNAHQISN